MALTRRCIRRFCAISRSVSCASEVDSKSGAECWPRTFWDRALAGSFGCLVLLIKNPTALTDQEPKGTSTMVQAAVAIGVRHFAVGRENPLTSSTQTPHCLVVS